MLGLHLATLYVSSVLDVINDKMDTRRSISQVLALLLVTMQCSSGLDNGLALTPPMGWLTWERFRCNTDCVNRPDECISENLIKAMANIMAKEGYLKAGYQYIIIDDCWLAPERDSNGRLQPDPDRFPSGIAALADYVSVTDLMSRAMLKWVLCHMRQALLQTSLRIRAVWTGATPSAHEITKHCVHMLGLKFGIYEDFGVRTCGGYPGSEFYLQLDANTFADWGVDYVKFDGCNSDPSDMDFGYEAFGLFLNKTGRPMVYSCEWPVYQQFAGLKPDYTSIQRTCNLWRDHADISDEWSSVSSIISYYGANINNLASFAKPGAWNDPDMLRTEPGTNGDVGHNGVPLLMSTDLRSITPEYQFLLLNSRLIAINQDPLGIQGQRILKINGTFVEVWSRPLVPKGSYAIAFLQLINPGDPTLVSVQARDIGLTAVGGYSLTDGFTGQPVGAYLPDYVLKLLINPNGVVLFKAIPIFAL